jgi:DNA-binding transcriptional ArsR family regulator
MDMEDEASPRLLWDWGTAYDLFVSLEVLHEPAEFDVRRAWAAGMRARLPADAREMLEQTRTLGHVPLHWIYALPHPKDGAAVLWSLGQVPPADRLAALTLPPNVASDVVDILQAVAARRAWDEGDEEALQATRSCQEKSLPCLKDPANALEWWVRAEEFGERYLEALRAYQEVFFAEEERRIRPALQEALARAQELSERLSLPDLLEELSQGLRLAEPLEAAELVLAPSYWSTPLVYMGCVSADRDIWLFGARPPDASLVPGDAVPDAMTRALKALSDPTRLRILRYLSEEPLTPAQLARRLRLRAPTVTHHLRALRRAGLVQVTLEDKREKNGKEHYAVRSEAVAATFASLKGFLEKGEADE